MRSSLCMLLLACGGTHATPSSTPQLEPARADTSLLPEKPPITPAGEPCKPDEEVGVAGSHDRYMYLDEKLEKFGYKTKAGTIALKPIYRDAYEFTRGGVATVGDATDGWRFIDPDGKVLAKAYVYDNGGDYFQEGFTRIVDGTGKLGFISTSGRILVAPKYDFVYPFCHGIAKTALGGVGGYLDQRGKAVDGPPDDDRPLIPPSSGG